MIKFSEYVSLGHPDKIADYISSYLLDRYIERDPATRYAVEVQIKSWRVTLGGEVSSKCSFTPDEIAAHVRAAVNEIGYTREYLGVWGHENAICGDLLEVESLISQQSPDIARGLKGWGDQGIFFGHAEYLPQTGFMPMDYTLARRLNKALFESGIGGLDIKTQVVLRDDAVEKIIVAIPLLDDHKVRHVRRFVHKRIHGNYDLIINGTGVYRQHSTIADCGTTGRKLAVDFYGGNCRIGGGSPWTKDGSKADLSLNLCARKLARCYAIENKCDVDVSLACCIGKTDVDMLVQDKAGNVLAEGLIEVKPQDLITAYELDKPKYASMCRWGLFGETQSDRMWEK